jgi:hypothetical protein
MNAPHPYLETDWRGVAMSLADVITALHPEYSPEVLAVISHHTKAVAVPPSPTFECHA